MEETNNTTGIAENINLSSSQQLPSETFSNLQSPSISTALNGESLVPSSASPAEDKLMDPPLSLNEEELGVIPRSRSVIALLDLLDTKTAQIGNVDYTVNCQIMQMYNEKIFDLIQDKRREIPLQLREAPERGSTPTVHVKVFSSPLLS